MNIYALHGFLGLPSDWNFLRQHFPENVQLHPIDIYNEIYPKPNDGLTKWAQSFKSSINTKKNNVLLGYSLGGRLGLHVLAHEPKLWDRAIIVSASVGSLTEQEKFSRLSSDNQWSQRFATEDWEALMKAWNDQPIFNGCTKLQRIEQNYSRKALSDSLTGWSLALQENLLAELKTLDIPVLWIVGQNDNKYVEQTKQLSLKHPHSKIWIAPGAGHRVPWDDQIAFSNEIIKFLNLGR